MIADQLKLVMAQLFSGAGIASGFAVGGILAERLSGHTSMAGLAQMCVILGAGLLAYPLAKLAGRTSRRRALTLGFGIGTVGAAIVLVGVVFSFLPVFLLGMMFCGSATASGLQARYAAVDLVDPAAAGRAMSFVVWATTIGSIAGPNFTALGAHLGEAIGLDPLAGPYVISMVCFLVASLSVALLRPLPHPDSAEAAAGPDERAGFLAALSYAWSTPKLFFALVTVVGGQMMMVSVMVMTPVHMDHQHFTLEVVGIVISFHIAGMYILSPLFGWLADVWNPQGVIVTGMVVFALTFAAGIVAALQTEQSMILLVCALFGLGIGWSMFLIGGSTLLTSDVPARLRTSLQGASDSLMNLGGALMAGLAGGMLMLGGFVGLNLMAACVLLVVALVGLRAWASRPARHSDTEAAPATP